MSTDSRNPIVFSADWFAHHQRLLVTLLAWPIIGRLFRRLLCIRACDVGYRGNIVELGPHYYTVANADGSFTSDFRTHEKYGKRLYHALLPLWKCLHWWDMAVANPLVPALNAGFDTLTVYPDAHPETSTCDGYAVRNPAGELWASIIAGAGTGSVDDTANNQYLGWMRATTVSNQFDMLSRGFFLFDTSAIGASAVVSSADLSIAGLGGSTQDNLGASPTFDVYTATPASNTGLVAADFAQVGSTSQTGSPVTYATIIGGGGGYIAFTFNGTGRGNIAQTGISKFSIRNANNDVAASAPPWVSGAQTVWETYGADQTGSSNDPKLVVTYARSSGWPYSHLGRASGIGFSDQRWPA